MQAERIERLEADLKSEREAHASTLRDAEATLMDLEGIQAADTGRSAAIQSAQAELQAERSMREQAEVSPASSSSRQCRSRYFVAEGPALLIQTQISRCIRKLAQIRTSQLCLSDNAPQARSSFGESTFSSV